MQRRALSMSWTRGRRELCLSGRLPLEQGAIFEQAIWDIAKQQRAADKQAGSVLDWQQSAADALVTLAQHGGGERGVRRSPTTLIVHLSDDAPPLLEGAGPISPRDRRAAHLRRAAPHDQAAAGAISCTRASGAARPTRRCARCTSARTIASTRAVPPRASSKGTTSLPTWTADDRARQPDPPLPPTPQAAARPAHPHQRHRRRAHVHGRGGPRDHHQPTTRTTPLTAHWAQSDQIHGKSPETSGCFSAPERRQ